MPNPALLTTCIECEKVVSIKVDRCPRCHKNPKGTPCAICRRPMSDRELVMVSLPHGTGRDEGGETFRHYHKTLTHQVCWDSLVAELFPVGSLKATCSACDTERPVPSPTDIGFPRLWTCPNCAHPCRLKVNGGGWCSACGLEIVPKWHSYWSVQNPSSFNGGTWEYHQSCRRRPNDKVYRWTLHTIDQMNESVSWWRRIFR